MAIRTVPKASARQRLLDAANELFYSEGIQTVGIDRVIEHAGVAKASLYNTFRSKEGLVCAYLDLRSTRIQERIARTLARCPTPRERLLGIFDAQGEAFAEPGYRGCAFMRATAEAPDDGSVTRVAEAHRAWLRGLFTELAAESGYADPEALARQLHCLYDGAAHSARMDRDLSASASARVAAAVLLDAAPLAETATSEGPRTGGPSEPTA
ncbi:TetR/AcrR family transcriptional regulator [Streptomyces sp. 142MFCol3.1]|uniref:TetR/AcrR family transcriptional regulator n=1 Tax=Streptomyces sp. 142MFCol3.1 TaxID=1172179 RepID=UPI000404665E|nr:TetR/AcrR family transcriptional regulator [Streptomyces sp. 142MFCol3.1]